MQFNHGVQIDHQEENMFDFSLQEVQKIDNLVIMHGLAFEIEHHLNRFMYIHCRKPICWLI